MSVIRIASRVSKLALIQTEYVKARLERLEPNLEVEIVGIKTQGDKILDKTLAKIGGKGLFIKELEVALLENKADLAVHSMKDVPFQLEDNLVISAICEREDPRDALVSQKGLSLNELPKGAIIGSSSLRRAMQVLHLRNDLLCKPLRGNVLTRLEKCQQGEYDAIVLASAGLHRLGLSQNITEYFDVEQCLPAVGQGAIGIETRTGDKALISLVKKLTCQSTFTCVQAERAMSLTLQGSCSVPLAGYAHIGADNLLHMTGKIGWPDGSLMIEASGEKTLDEAHDLGVEIAQQLLAQGAQEILDGCR